MKSKNFARKSVAIVMDLGVPGLKIVSEEDSMKKHLQNHIK